MTISALATNDHVSAIAGADGVFRIVLERPPVNALRQHEYDALCEAFEIAGASDCGCMLFSTRGRLFCAGGDLGERVDEDSDGVPNSDGPLSVLYANRHCALPTVTAVHGTAAGFGNLMAFCSDVVVAEAGVSFIMPEIDTGAVGGVCALTYAMPTPMARYMGLAGQRVPAERLAEVGAVARIVAKGEAWAVADALAVRIAARHRSGAVRDWGKLRASV